MNGTVSMSDEIISSGTELPRILSAEPETARQISIVWTSGDRKTVDLAPVLQSRRIYIPLRTDEALFRTLKVSPFGDAIEWADGTDISAVWLSKLPSTLFDNQDFIEAMEKLGMSLDGMALTLDISRRLVADYRKNKPIPRHIAYATRYLVERSEQGNNQGETEFTDYIKKA